MSHQVSPRGVALGVAVVASVVLWNLYDLRDSSWAESVLTYAFFGVFGALVGAEVVGSQGPALRDYGSASVVACMIAALVVMARHQE